ncbi:hypothetical protein [Methylobacterium sp. ARG-1]|uniref:hypothetical protein n=1 Tax=Methylobacterium sp. ARG-1 TaxID=1692501 RepID=UPI0006804273|nr:hypothetical protein [Methylobacterium sp. ARG-1]KNY20348.1 hypothetical protein AKJ13_23005 [Methylobacterium sp. ARG-1]
MRTLKKVAVLAMMMMAAMAKTVWEGGKWVTRSLFPNLAPPPADDVEEALDRVAATPPADGGAPLPLASVDAGQRVFDYALSKLSDGRHPRPAMSDVPEDIVRWVARLSAADLHRLTQHGPKRVGEHVLGVKAIADLPLCRQARVEPGFAKIGDVIQYVGRIAKADVGPTPAREETPRETALAILQDLIDDQPEPAGLKVA